MEWWKERGGGGSCSCDVGQSPIVGGIRCDLVALEEERNLSLQIVAGNQERSEGGLELCVAEELLERRFQSIGGIFRQEQLVLGRQNIFVEDGRPILEIEVEEFARGVRAIILADGPDSQSDNAASRCSCD